jgi:predicted transport protein
MADLDKALATQLSNFEKRTGKSLEELVTLVKKSSLSKHGELVTMLKSTLGMGHGDANLVVHVARKAGDPSPASAQDRSVSEVLDDLYAGPKAELRPIHETLLKELERVGEYEWQPKKTYISYRLKKQFAMIGPATNTRVEVGLNMKGVEPTERLQALPAGQMCNYKVKLSDSEEVDTELMGWLRTAYQAAG